MTLNDKIIERFEEVEMTEFREIATLIHQAEELAIGHEDYGKFGAKKIAEQVESALAEQKQAMLAVVESLSVKSWDAQNPKEYKESSLKAEGFRIALDDIKKKIESEI